MHPAGLRLKRSLRFKNSVFMKRNILWLSLLTFAVLPACGGDADGTENGTDTTTANADFTGMSEISLKESGLNMTIMLPEVASPTGASVEPQIDHEVGDYIWDVIIGQHFHLVIEDFGKEKDRVADEKKRLGDLGGIFVTEYIVDEPKLIMYKRTLHEGQGGKPSYHCYGQVQVDGFTYILRSHEDGGLKPIIEDMVKTIRSAKQIGAVAA